MRILFCNVGWMKYYNGQTEDDKSGENIKAIQYCNKVLKDYPENLGANNCKGNALLNLNMFDEAIRYYYRALEIDSNSIYVYYNLGLAYGLKGDNEKALEYLNKLLLVEYDNAYALAFKGLALLNLERIEGTIPELLSETKEDRINLF